MSDLFAPEGGWRVRILDLSADEAERVLDEVPGFPSLMQANAFARAYVRDSVERCRLPGETGLAVMQSWLAFGEDAEVIDAGEQGWASGPVVADFAAQPASEEERDWRSLDPRDRERALAIDDEDEDDDEDEAADEDGDKGGEA